MCTHYWLLAAPTSPYTQGTCKKCGDTREFQHQWDIKDENWLPRIGFRDEDLNSRYSQALEVAGRKR